MLERIGLVPVPGHHQRAAAQVASVGARDLLELGNELRVRARGGDPKSQQRALGGISLGDRSNHPRRDGGCFGAGLPSLEHDHAQVPLRHAPSGGEPDHAPAVDDYVELRHNLMLPGGPCQTGAVNERKRRLQAARLYLVCGAVPDDFLAAAVRGGVDIVQLRMKDASDAAILAGAERFLRHDVLLIINDRPDLAVAAGGDGVHVGQDDMSVDEARAIVGQERLVGLSTHTPEQVDRADGADYIGVGPVYATPTKPGRPAVGVELVRHASGHAPVPFFAIGGINAVNLSAVRAAGAERVAVVRALTEADDPERAARTLRA